MAVYARIWLEQANGPSGRTVNASLIVQNSGEAQPTNISRLYLFDSNRGQPTQFSGPMFGGGGGAGADTPEVVPHTVNVDTSRSYNFTFSAQGSMDPAKQSGTMVTIGANVILSDGTVVVADPATFTVVPLEYVSAAGTGEQPTARFIGSQQGVLDFSSSENAVYV